MSSLQKILSLLIVSALVISSCKKDEPIIEEPSPFWGEATALRNGEPLKFECSTLLSTEYENKFSMALEHFNEYNELRGSFLFRHIPLLKGSYYPEDAIVGTYIYLTPLDTLFSLSYYSLQSDGDVAGDRFKLARDSSAIFTLDSIDDNTGEIWGTFEVEMVKDTTALGELDPSVPYELKFKSGVFHTKVRLE